MSRVVLYGTDHPTGGTNNVVRFLKRGWRTLSCAVCHCLVKRLDVFDHAIYHVEQGEAQFDRPGAGPAHVTVYPDHCVWHGATTDNPGAG